MFDLLALAFQADLTRVTTMMVGRESSIRSYDHLGIPESHHQLSHHRNDPADARQADQDPDLPHGAFSPSSSPSSRPRRTATRSLLDRSHDRLRRRHLRQQPPHRTTSCPSSSSARATAVCGPAGTSTSARTLPSRTCFSPCSTAWACGRVASATAPACWNWRRAHQENPFRQTRHAGCSLVLQILKKTRARQLVLRGPQPTPVN